MAISSLSTQDYILLEATFTNHNDRYFQCRYKESLTKTRSDHEYLVRDERRKKGCFVIGSEAMFETNGIEFYSCLCHPNFQHELYYDYLELFHNFKNHGLLPFEGCYMDQPAKILEAINYIGSLVAKKEYEDQLKSNKEV